MLKKTTQSPPEFPTPGDRYTNTDFPDFRGLKVFVLDGAFRGSVVELMARCNFTMAKEIKEADLCVFVGGCDVDPALYGEKNVASSISSARDALEVDVYAKCLEWDVPMFGICRGFQHLAVMNGGKLWQHVNNHGRAHDIVDTETGMLIKASSIHHQMVKQTQDMTVLAVTDESVATQFRDADKTLEIVNRASSESDPLEIEAACWVDTKCIGVQGHPELLDSVPEFASWTMHKVADFLAELELMEGGDPFLSVNVDFMNNSVH